MDSAYDCVVIGAGVSGINLACRLRQRFGDDLRFILIDRRPELGGTWSLFRYPGIRSDSDVFTYGYPFEPMFDLPVSSLHSSQPNSTRGPSRFASGEQILAYLHAAVDRYRLKQHMLFESEVTACDWSDDRQIWTLQVKVSVRTPEFEKQTCTRPPTTMLFCKFIAFAAGYYDYDATFPDGLDLVRRNFGGQIVEPQFWPARMDLRDKHVVVVGSGATAVTLLPALVGVAKSVTQVQRSPSYILAVNSRPSVVDTAITRLLPRTEANTVLRLKYAVAFWLSHQLARRLPLISKWLYISHAFLWLGFRLDLSSNFIPSHTPWQQRVCVTPNGDYFRCLATDQARIVTGAVESAATDGVLFEHGKKVRADVVVLATGLKLTLLGKILLTRNSKPINLDRTHVWQGSMLSDLPNHVIFFGATYASWTLASDMIAQTAAHILHRVVKEDESIVVAKWGGDCGSKSIPMNDMTSTYIRHADLSGPIASTKRGWEPRDNWLRDFVSHELRMSGSRIF